MNGELRRKVKQERIFMEKPSAWAAETPKQSASKALLLSESRIFREGPHGALVVPTLANDNSLDTITIR